MRVGSDHPQELEVVETVPHSEHNDYYNDIALIRLKNSIEFSSNAKTSTNIRSCYNTKYFLDEIKPICLPLPGSHTPSICDDLTVIGWGKPGTEDSEVQKKNVQIVVSKEQCEEYFKNKVEITPQLMCINQTDVGEISCSGGSGNPVMSLSKDQWQLEAVHSFGPTDCQPGVISGNMKVTEYLEWMRLHMHN